MATLCGIYLTLLAFFLIGLMYFQARAGKVDLLCTRNFFILGFIVFQLTGGAASLFFNEWGYFHIQNYSVTPLIYSIACTIFTVLLLAFYAKGWITARLAQRFRLQPVAAGAGSLLTLAWVFIGVGMAFRFGFVYIPLIGGGFDMLGNGMLAAAAGMATWAAVSRLMNPFVVVLTAGVIVVAAVVTISGDFGRRDLLGVIGCIGWAAFHGYWKHLGFKAAWWRLVVVGSAGFLFLAAFTAAREGSFRDKSSTEILSSLQGADVGSGAWDLITGQNAGANSMWIMENYPENRDFDTFHTLRSVVLFPIPRTFIPELKPVALALSMPDDAGIRNKPENWNIGPGIIGHIAHDNGWLAMIPYALFIGLYLRFFDEVVRQNPLNPFAILPMGVALGQFIGMPRGEFALFFVLSIVYSFGTFAVMMLCYQGMKILGWTIRPDAEEELYDQELAEHYGEEAYDHAEPSF
ncbi:MAG: hypothetical protein HND58_01075 [Planctomycetota bacterium]|nr:MAG: hypothetical protein HND58_01075 [Planctomycetota bacterium]